MKILLILAVIALAFTLGPLTFMWAWNTSAVSMFHAPAIGFWQALGALLVIGLVGNAFRATVNIRRE